MTLKTRRHLPNIIRDLDIGTLIIIYNERLMNIHQVIQLKFFRGYFPSHNFQIRYIKLVVSYGYR